MQKFLIAATLAAAASLAGATTLNAGAYTVTYDETTSFGSLGGWFSTSSGTFGFEWNTPESLNLTSSGGAAQSVSFDLPTFTLSVNPGYAFSGLLVASYGNLTYAQFAGDLSVSAAASVSVNGSPAVSYPLGSLTKVSTTAVTGYFADTATAPLDGVTTLTVSNASLTLSATAGTVGAIIGQGQNKLRFEFVAAPVPEPETYALLLAGLGVVGMLARRRRQH
jgi:hypothetical protein